VCSTRRVAGGNGLAALIGVRRRIDNGETIMDFSEAIGSGLQNYVNFSGRATPSEYWYGRSQQLRRAAHEIAALLRVMRSRL